jgi:hypothetical protein
MLTVRKCENDSQSEIRPVSVYTPCEDLLEQMNQSAFSGDQEQIFYCSKTLEPQ